MTSTTDHIRTLPWTAGTAPLMLAPMQGLTNRALRALFIQRVRPDTVFTEFVRVNPVAGRRHIAAADLKEMAAAEDGVPLVVQLIGHGPETLAAAAEAAQAAGAVHLNLNLGCPYGRMTTGLTGGGMLQRPECVREIVPALRKAVTGTFSVKLRAGYDDPAQVYSLLPLFEDAGVDFLVLHPRTVVQEYKGAADHTVTTEVVRRTRLPVIANGDIRSAADGQRLLRETGAAGLMLGRGAIADPLLFLRLRGEAAAEPGPAQRAAELQAYLRDLLERYRQIFCGDTQVLNKIKGVFATMDDPALEKPLRKLKRATTIRAFTDLLDGLSAS
jgi:tRNA-dihydrouridine synthase